MLEKISMSQLPLVSICIRVYCSELYIEECIRSVFFQTYENLEIVVVDDNSPDSSVSIIQKVIKDYPHREPQLKIIHLKKNVGAASISDTNQNVE